VPVPRILAGDRTRVRAGLRLSLGDEVGITVVAEAVGGATC
jgi:hypothetical protein